MPVRSMSNTPECNTDWDTKEAACRNSRLEYFAHHCMVHLPATNKWSTSHLPTGNMYAKCDKCVQDYVGEGFSVSFSF